MVEEGAHGRWLGRPYAGYGVAHLLPVERRVVHEEDVLGAELGVLDDLGHPGALGRPVDPREDELVPEAIGGQPLAGGVRVVLRADGVQDPAPVEGAHHLRVALDDGHGALAQGPFPEGVVEVPDDELDRFDEVVARPAGSRRPWAGRGDGGAVPALPSERLERFELGVVHVFGAPA